METIKEYKQEWLDECERFNTPDDDFVSAIDRDLFGSIYDAVARELGLADLLDVPTAGQGVGEGEEGGLAREDALKAFALALMYLSAGERPSASAKGDTSYVAPTSIGKETVDALCEDGFIVGLEGGQVELTQSGLAMAEELISAFGFDSLL